MASPKDSSGIDVAKTLGVSRKRAFFSRLFKFLFWCLVLAALGGGAYVWLNRDTTASVSYETQPVEKGNLVVTVSATGTLEPIKTVEVGIEVSGTVKTVEVDYNDRVEVGQVLAEIDTSKLAAQALQSEAALESARAKLLQAQASVKEAELQMARLDEIKELSDGKMPSKFEYDAQKAALARAHAEEAGAKAAVSQAQATVDANRSDLDKAVVHSPVNGIVLERSVEPGQTVAAQFQSPVLFTLAEDLTQMELQADVDEADVGKVKEGQDATFTVDAYPNRVFPAKITQVRFGSETVEGVVTYKTILSVDNAELQLRPGMTATAQIVVDKREAVVLVPNVALRFSPPVEEEKQESGGGMLLSKIMPHPPRPSAAPRAANNVNNKAQEVWVLRGGKMTAVSITKGLSDGKMTEVVTGELEPGMELITDMTGAK
jgi:HlyD family secretion protein